MVSINVFTQYYKCQTVLMLQDSYFILHHKKRHIDNGGLGIDCHGELKTFWFTICFNGVIILGNIFVAKWSSCCIIGTVFRTVNASLYYGCVV